MLTIVYVCTGLPGCRNTFEIDERTFPLEVPQFHRESVEHKVPIQQGKFKSSFAYLGRKGNAAFKYMFLALLLAYLITFAELS